MNILTREAKIESGRRNDFIEDVRRGWFEKLGGILRTNNLITKPHAIFNCCERSISDETSCEWVMVSHETKHAYEQCGGSAKNFTTSLICGNATDDILPPFPSFNSNASFNSSLFNNFDLQSGELNNSLLPIDKNLSFNQISESLENFSKVPIRDVIWYDNDGQRILGFDPLTLPKPLGQHSGYSNDVLQPKMSVTDFEKENDENNRMYTELQTVTMQRLVAPFESSQRVPINIDTEMINPIPSTQLSSPSAVRSIVTNLIQQHIPPPSSSSNTTKRTRGEGKYGEEITSSNRLNDLKEKSSKLSSKKRSIKSTTETSETSVFASGDDLEVTKKKKPTRAIATVEILAPRNEDSNGYNIISSIKN
ncbi:unnamed protein product [Rotaria magnacalcarata]|uniref:Uncharacterized protein n=1 Tax=Rotaria magnacalcarata TaxID=392030 RepID=A0A8S2MGG5_9BILA|nr:unnamed protein product [Rotaria magnacalcarata]